MGEATRPGRVYISDGRACTDTQRHDSLRVVRRGYCGSVRGGK